MRTIILVLTFVVSAFGLQAQRFEGTLTWKITSEITDPDIANGDGLEAMLPTGLVVKFNDKRTLSVFQGGAAAGMELLHLPERDKYQLFRIDRVAKTYTPLGYDKSAAAPENEKVRKTKETRKILGYTCTKYVVDILYGDDMMQQVFWATTELKDVYYRGMAHQRFFKGQPEIFYRKIKGVPLLMELKHPKRTLRLEATDVKREVFATEDFVIPEGFQEVRRFF